MSPKISSRYLQFTLPCRGSRSQGGAFVTEQELLLLSTEQLLSTQLLLLSVSMLPEVETVNLTALPKEGKTGTHKIWVVSSRKGLAWLGNCGNGYSGE